MDRYKSYKERLANLDSEKRSKFEFLYYLATIHSGIRVADLVDQYLIRRRVALIKYKDFTAFEYDELYNANDKLTSVNLPCEWMKFYGELRDIDHEIDTAKKEKKYDQAIDHHYNMIYLFASILFEAQLEEYLNIGFDFDITIPYYGKYDIKNLKDFDKVIELLARFRWIVKLKNMIEIADYNRNAPKEKRIKPFKSLFLDETHGAKILKILSDEDYLFSGIWNYSGNDKSIATPFYVLRDYFGLFKKDGSPLGTKLKIWCFGLGIIGNDGFIKNLKNNPDVDGKNPTYRYRQEQKEFFKIFENHFPHIKELPDQEDYSSNNNK